MKFKFESLLIWQKAMDLGDNMDKLTELFPEKEIYNFCRGYMKKQKPKEKQPGKQFIILEMLFYKPKLLTKLDSVNFIEQCC